MEKFLLKYSSVVLQASSLLLQLYQHSRGEDLQTFVLPSESQKIRKFHIFVCVIIIFLKCISHLLHPNNSFCFPFSEQFLLLQLLSSPDPLLFLLL